MNTVKFAATDEPLELADEVLNDKKLFDDQDMLTQEELDNRLSRNLGSTLCDGVGPQLKANEDL